MIIHEEKVTWAGLDREHRHLLIEDLYRSKGVTLTVFREGEERWDVVRKDRASPIDDAWIDYSGEGAVSYDERRGHFRADMAYALVHELSHVVYGRATNHIDPEEQELEHLCAIMALDWIMCDSIGLLGSFWNALSDYSVTEGEGIRMPDGSEWTGYLGNASSDVVRTMMARAFEDGVGIGVITLEEKARFDLASTKDDWRSTRFQEITITRRNSATNTATVLGSNHGKR